MERLLTDIEAAEKMNLVPGTLRMWRLANTGPRYLKIGRSVRYRLVDIEEFLAQRVIEPSQEAQN
jgi:predicted DNA-binding transcriptional regulator AlpA